MRLAPPVTSISKRSAASAAPADSRSPTPLVTPSFWRSNSTPRVPPDSFSRTWTPARSLEPGVVGAADKPDRDDARRLAECQPQLIDAAGQLERAQVDGRELALELVGAADRPRRPTGRRH